MSDRPQKANKKSSARITADPNPVPTGASYGTTTISWDTGDGQQGDVYVDMGGEPEKHFGRGATGALPAPWIGPRSTYVFRLYRSGDRSKPIAFVVVTPQPGAAVASGRPSIEANPNPVPRLSGYSKTLVNWTTGDGSYGEVYVSPSGGPEERFAQGNGGSNEAPWIGRGSYAFTLYAGKEHKVALAKVVVHREGEVPPR